MSCLLLEKVSVRGESIITPLYCYWISYKCYMRRLKLNLSSPQISRKLQDKLGDFPFEAKKQEFVHGKNC